MKALITFGSGSKRFSTILDLAMRFVAGSEHAGYYSTPGEQIRGHDYGFRYVIVPNEYHQDEEWAQWKTCAGNVLRWRQEFEMVRVYVEGRRHGIPWWVLGKAIELLPISHSCIDKEWEEMKRTAIIDYIETQEPELKPWETNSDQLPNFCINEYIERRAKVYREIADACIEL